MKRILGILAILVALTGLGGGDMPANGSIPLDFEPNGVLCDAGCRHLFVTQQGSHTVRVIDTRAENRTPKLISLPFVPSQIAAMSRDRLLVAASSDNDPLGAVRVVVQIISATDGKKEAEWTITWRPVWMTAVTSMSITPHERRAYMTAYDSILVINLNRPYTPPERITYSTAAYNDIGCPESSGVALGRLLYVSVQCVGLFRPGHDPVWVYSTANAIPVGVVNFLNYPNVGGILAVRPDGREVWVSGTNVCADWRYGSYDPSIASKCRKGQPVKSECRNSGGTDPISIIDTRDNRVVKQLFIGSPAVLAFTPNGKYALAGIGDKLYFIDAHTYNCLPPRPGPVLGRIGLDAESQYAYLPLEKRIEIIALPRAQDRR